MTETNPYQEMQAAHEAELDARRSDIFALANARPEFEPVVLALLLIADVLRDIDAELDGINETVGAIG